MSDLPDLQAVDSAEALFEALDVRYDPRVLAVARLHVLRRYGQLVAAAGEQEAATPEERRERHRAALAQAHAELETTSPRDARMFGCFQERAPLVVLGRRKA